MNAPEGLQSCIRELHSGSWEFIQLRDTLINEDSINGDDVDLLGTEESVEQLLKTAFGWVKSGRCHIQMVRGRPQKIELTLISLDGMQRLILDLWIEIWQLDRGSRRLIYADCAPAIQESNDSIKRLNCSVEASVFLHHLATKKKRVSDPKQMSRLKVYVSRSECRELNEILKSVTQTSKITDSDLAVASQQLRKSTKVYDAIAQGNFVKWLAGKPYSQLLKAPKRLKSVSFMGCDGCGKTSLAHAVSENRRDIDQVFTGKHLYRKSWFYKFLVIFVRPFLFQNRESFDETFAWLAYLRASIGLRVKLWGHKNGIVLIDRSIIDFLFIGRKTEEPRFSRFRFLSSWMGCRLPTVHFVLPFKTMSERKQEVSQKGQEEYDRAMFEHFTTQCPTHYLVLNNQGTLEQAVSAMNKILDELKNED